MHEHAHTHTHKHTHACAHVHNYVHTHLYMHTMYMMCVCVRTHVRVCMHCEALYPRSSARNKTKLGFLVHSPSPPPLLESERVKGEGGEREREERRMEGEMGRKVEVSNR